MNDTGFIWGMSLLGLVFVFEVLAIKRMWGDFHFRRYWRRRPIQTRRNIAREKLR